MYRQPGRQPGSPRLRALVPEADSGIPSSNFSNRILSGPLPHRASGPPLPSLRGLPRLTYLDIPTLQPIDTDAGEEGPPKGGERNSLDKLCEKMDKLGDMFEKLSNELDNVGNKLSSKVDNVQRSLCDIHFKLIVIDDHSSQQFADLRSRMTKLEETQTQLATSQNVHTEARQIRQELEDLDASLSLQITALKEAVNNQDEVKARCEEVEEILAETRCTRQKTEESIRNLRLETATRAGAFNQGLRVVQASTTGGLEGLQRVVLSGMENNRLTLDREIKEEIHAIAASLSGAHSSLAGHMLDIKNDIQRKTDALGTMIGKGQASLEGGHRDILDQFQDLPFAVRNVIAEKGGDDETLLSASDTYHSTEVNFPSAVRVATVSHATTDTSQPTTDWTHALTNTDQSITDRRQSIDHWRNEVDEGQPQRGVLTNDIQNAPAFINALQLQSSLGSLSPSSGRPTSNEVEQATQQPPSGSRAPPPPLEQPLRYWNHPRHPGASSSPNDLARLQSEAMMRLASGNYSGPARLHSHTRSRPRIPWPDVDGN